LWGLPLFATAKSNINITNQIHDTAHLIDGIVIKLQLYFQTT